MIFYRMIFIKKNNHKFFDQGKKKQVSCKIFWQQKIATLGLDEISTFVEGCLGSSDIWALIWQRNFRLVPLWKCILVNKVFARGSGSNAYCKNNYGIQHANAGNRTWRSRWVQRHTTRLGGQGSISDNSEEQTQIQLCKLYAMRTFSNSSTTSCRLKLLLLTIFLKKFLGVIITVIIRIIGCIKICIMYCFGCLRCCSSIAIYAIARYTLRMAHVAIISLFRCL